MHVRGLAGKTSRACRRPISQSTKLDPSYDQKVDYARRLLQTDNGVELRCCPGAFDEFTVFDTALSRRARASDVAAMDRLMNGSVSS